MSDAELPFTSVDGVDRGERLADRAVGLEHGDAGLVAEHQLTSGIETDAGGVAQLGLLGADGLAAEGVRLAALAAHDSQLGERMNELAPRLREITRILAQTKASNYGLHSLIDAIVQSLVPAIDAVLVADRA